MNLYTKKCLYLCMNENVAYRKVQDCTNVMEIKKIVEDIY
jgi:hypothetical protein